MRNVMIILFIFLQAIGFGAYSSSDVSILAGGWGYAAVNGDTLVGYNYTIGDISNCAKTSGTLSRVKVRLYDAATAAVSEARIQVMRGAASPYTIVGYVDITAHLAAAQAVSSDRFAYDTSATYGTTTVDIEAANISVVEGDFIAIVAKDGAGNAIGFPRKTNAGYNLVTSPTASYDTLGADADKSLYMDFWVKDNSCIAFDDDNSSAGYGNGDTVLIPYYTESQYIILEDVVVPDTEDLSVALDYTAADSADTAAKTLQIDFTGGANDQKISIDGFVSSKSIAYEADETNIYIYCDPVNDKIEVLFYDRADGAGPTGGDSDIKHISITDRSPVALADFDLRRIAITNAGGNANIARILVARNPILIVGDSFGSSASSGKTVLANVGAKLDDSGVFSEQRYVINGCIAGNRTTEDVAGTHTAVYKRWNDWGNDGDLCAYRDVVVIPINGPILNDIAPVGTVDATADKWAYVSGCAGVVSKIVSDALKDDDTYGGANDVVLCEAIPYPDGSQLDIDSLNLMNQLLNAISYRCQIPIARCNLGYDIVNDYSDSSPRTHPDADGCTYITSKIVDAYENNRRATKSQAGFGNQARPLMGDGFLTGNQ